MATNTTARPTAPRPARRRFTLADAMISVAALGVSTARGRSDFYPFLLNLL